MANSWVLEIDNLIFTYLRTKLIKAFKSEFPDIQVTNTEDNIAPAKFPTVNITPIGMTPIASDLGNTSYNGISSTYQISVVVNTVNADASKIMGKIIEIMAEKHYFSTTGATFEYGNGSIRRVARFNNPSAMNGYSL